MDQDVMQMVLKVASVLSSVLVLVALFLLWSKSQSSWLLLARGRGHSCLYPAAPRRQTSAACELPVWAGSPTQAVAQFSRT